MISRPTGPLLFDTGIYIRFARLLQANRMANRSIEQCSIDRLDKRLQCCKVRDFDRELVTQLIDHHDDR